MEEPNEEMTEIQHRLIYRPYVPRLVCSSRREHCGCNQGFRKLVDVRNYC